MSDLKMPDLPDLPDMRVVVDWHWMIGCSLALVSCLLSNIGLNLQKLSHLENQYWDPRTRTRPKLETDHIPMTQRPRWKAGMALIVIGALFDFSALGFAAQSLIATLGSLTLVFNAIFAPLMLGETVTSSDIQATVTIVLGCVIAVVYAQHESEIYTLHGLLKLYLTQRFVVYALVVTALVASAWGCIHFIEARYRDLDDTTGVHSFHYPNKAVQTFHKIAYAGVAGTTGAQSVLFAKSTAELLKTTLSKRGMMFTHIGAYAILAALTFTITMQIRWLNGALARFDALYIIPVFQTFWIIAGVLGGLIFYNEWRDFTPTQAVMFPIGILFTLYGVYVLSHRSSGLQDAAQAAGSSSAAAAGSSSAAHGSKRVMVGDDHERRDAGEAGEAGEGDSLLGGRSPRPVLSEEPAGSFAVAGALAGLAVERRAAAGYESEEEEEEEEEEE